MSEQSRPLVDCPICGEDFDPTAAGGWCTNSDCGEYQHDGEDVPDASGAGSDDEGPQPIVTPVLDETCEEGTDEGPTDAPPETEEDAADAGGARSDDEGEAGTDETESGAEPACPDCETAVDPEDAFCRACGAELDGSAPELIDCPNCGGSVDADDSYCGSCGEDLDAARDALATGDAAGDGAESSEETVPESGVPTSLVLRANDEEVAVTSGDTVGREVRRIVSESGGDEADAVRIHREHVRFVREDGRFSLVDLGDNPTVLNGDRLTKGDRRPVAPGDEIELSGVVTLTVAEP